MPKVTIVMAVHNGLQYLNEAVESILRQTLSDLEFIIIDDASTDGSLELLHRYKDKRIQVISNQHRIELSRSLNLGLDMATGEYVARMDYDDVSLPTRLQEQSRFLDANVGIDLLGTSAKTINLNPEQIWSNPKRDEDIRCEFVFNSAMVHSTVMMRRSTFDRHHLRYDPSIRRAQDYELWTRAAPTLQFANLSQVLLRYRVHQDQVGRRYEDEQQAAATIVRQRELGAIGVAPTRKEIDLHNQISQWYFSPDDQSFRNVENWLMRLEAANRSSNYLPVAAFGRALERRWWTACRSNINIGLKAWRAYSGSEISRLGKRGLISKSVFWIKALLGQLGWRSS